MTDPLDAFMRAELAATMLPCRELPRHERKAKRDADATTRKSVTELCTPAVESIVDDAESGAA